MILKSASELSEILRREEAITPFPPSPNATLSEVVGSLHEDHLTSLSGAGICPKTVKLGST